MEIVKKVLLSCFALLAVANLHAATITGGLGLGGSYVAAGGPDLVDITSISLDDTYSPEAGKIAGLFATSASGSFLSTINPMTFGTAGIINIDTFAPVPDFIVMGGFHFNLGTLDLVDHNAISDILHLEGTGQLYKDGFDLTAANWEINTEALGSYSMTITAVPVPAAVWLFGSGLIGLVTVSRRKA